MALLDIYKTEPERLLNAAHSDFDDMQWQDLAIHLGSYQQDAYDQNVMRHLLPIIGNRVLWLRTTSAQQFLYTAIFNNDVEIVDFILNTFENVRNGKGVIEGWEGYVETAVQEKLDHPSWSYAVLDRLLQHFDNRYGLGLLRCVQHNNLEVLHYILPHSDPSDDYFFAYRWAQVYNLTECERILNPLSDKFSALFGYRFDPWVEDDDQDRVRQISDQLEQDILGGLYDHEPLAALYCAACHGSMQHSDLLNAHSEDRTRLALLLCDNHPHVALEILKTIEALDDEVSYSVVRNFRHHPNVVIPILSESQRESALYNCAYQPEYKNFAKLLVDAGADPQKVLKKMMDNQNLHVFHQLDHGRSDNALNLMHEWISEWQAQTICEHLGTVDAGSKVSKI